MTTMLLGDFADFIGVSTSTINFCAKHASWFPAPIEKRRSGRWRIWDYEQLQALIKKFGSVEKTADAVREAARPYRLEVNRKSRSRSHRSNSAPKAKTYSPTHQSPSESEKFYCFSCETEHPIEQQAENGRRRPICIAKFELIQAKIMRNSEINLVAVRGL